MKTNMKNFLKKKTEKIFSIMMKIRIYIGCFILFPVSSFLLFNINKVTLTFILLVKFLILFIMALTNPEFLEIFINMECGYIGFDFFEGISQFSRKAGFDPLDEYIEQAEYQDYIQNPSPPANDDVADECPCPDHDLTSNDPDKCGCSHENTRPLEDG